jgi:hypothetical protein
MFVLNAEIVSINDFARLGNQYGSIELTGLIKFTEHTVEAVGHHFLFFAERVFF